MWKRNQFPPMTGEAPTEAPPGNKAVKQLVDHFQQETNGRIKVIGLAAPGLANEGNTAIAYMPNN